METTESYFLTTGHCRPIPSTPPGEDSASTVPPDLPDDDGPLTDEDWERFDAIIFEYFVAEP